MPQDKMPQCQKRTKCHNVDGEIRMQQKCYKDVTKVLQGCNKSVTRVKHGIIRMQQSCHKGVTWFDKDVAEVL